MLAKTVFYLCSLPDTFLSVGNFFGLLTQCNVQMVAVTVTPVNQLFHICREEPSTGRLALIHAKTWPREQLVSVYRKHFPVLWRRIVKHCICRCLFIVTQQHKFYATLINEAVCNHRVTYVQHL